MLGREEEEKQMDGFSICCRRGEDVTTTQPQDATSGTDLHTTLVARKGEECEHPTYLPYWPNTTPIRYVFLHYLGTLRQAGLPLPFALAVC